MASKGVILCGGPSKGTRMRPLSLTTAKSLFPIAGRPLIWHTLQAFSKIDGLNEVILIGFYEDAVFAPFVKSASKDFPNLKIRYLREFQSLGTAGGLFHFRDVVLKGNPEHIYVLNGDIACHFPLEELRAAHLRHGGVCTVMGVNMPKDASTQYGCVVIDEETHKARHYVEKPENFISSTINAGVYLFDAKSIFNELKNAVDSKSDAANVQDSLEPVNPDVLRLEQDVIAPLVTAGKIFVFVTDAPWRQIKSAGACVPANTLLLSSYKRNNPSLLRQRAPTVSTPPPAAALQSPAPQFKCEIVEPCYIDETAQIHPTAKIGPNVSIGANVKIGFGCRVKEAIVLDNSTLDKNACLVYSILDEDCHVGPWARVEGVPMTEAAKEKHSICILARGVNVAREVQIRSCIVLPDKSLSDSYAGEVLL